LQLSVVTRCCMRPELLRENVESVRKQTARFVQQIFIVDRHRQGISWANKQLHEKRNFVTGDYVFILDDDNILPDNEFWEYASLVAEYADTPEVLVTLALRPSGQRVFPGHEDWVNKNLVKARTNAHCYVVRSDIWKKHIISFGTPTTHSGAWQFPEAMLKHKPPYRWKWVEVIAGESVQLGRGHTDNLGEDWWEKYVLPEYPEMTRFPGEDIYEIVHT